MAMTLEIIELLRAFQSGLGSIRPDDEDDAATWDRIERAVSHLTQPARAVDVGAIREVIDDLREWGETDKQLAVRAETLTRALAGEQAGWRDMDSAPKNGADVLLAFTADGVRQVAEAHWSDDDDVWVCNRDGFMLYRRNEPTHWHPLPSLPASPTPAKETQR